MNLEQITENFKHTNVPEGIKHNIIKAFFDAKVNKIIAKNNAEVNQIIVASEAAAREFSTDPELKNRAINHFAKAMIESQVNREKVSAKAIANLNNTDFKSDATNEIDQDWLTQFWNLSSTKSNDEVQEILGKILAKEIIQPKSVSPNTIMLLSVLTSDVGLALNKLSNLSIDDGQYCFVIAPEVAAFVNYPMLEDYGVQADDLYELDAMKLIRAAEATQFTYENDLFQYDEINYAGLKAEMNFAGLSMYHVQFTKSGRELRNLIKLTENKLFTKKLKDTFKNAFRIIA